MARPKNFDRNRGVNELAREVGQSITTVSRKLREGKTPDQIRAEAAEWHAKEKKQAVTSENEGFYEAKTRKERMLADLRELELSVKRGELISLADVNAFIAGMILRARDVLCRIGPELQDRLAQESNPQRVRELLDEEIDRALAALAEYRPL